jgi:hypothetical protein
MREVKDDTAELLNDTSGIKKDTAEILELITRLESLQHSKTIPATDDQFMLNRYLDQLSTYAESTYQESCIDPTERLNRLSGYDSGSDAQSLAAIYEQA